MILIYQKLIAIPLPAQMTRPFLLFTTESSYSQFVDFPTNDNNVLDLILSNDANIISHVSPDFPLGTSDHVVVHFEIIVTVDSQCNADGFCTYNWPLADYEAIELYLSGIDWYGMVVTCPSASVLWDTFMSVLYTAIELYVPKRAVRRPVSYRKPLLRFTRELHKCLVKKRRLWRKLRVNKLDTVARLRYRECVNQWRSVIQQQLMQTEEQLIKSNNIGSFYKFVNKRISSRSGIPPIINETMLLLLMIKPMLACSMNISAV